MKYRAYAVVSGTKYLGEFEADSKEEALDKASNSDGSWISLCHHCTSECEDPEVVDIIVEES